MQRKRTITLRMSQGGEMLCWLLLSVLCPLMDTKSHIIKSSFKIQSATALSGYFDMGNLFEIKPQTSKELCIYECFSSSLCSAALFESPNCFLYKQSKCFCPVGMYTLTAGGNVCFKLHILQSPNIADAFTVCQSYGAFVMPILSAEDDQTIMDIVQGHDCEVIVTGGWNPVPGDDSKWQWNTSSFTSLPLTYTNWHHTQPDNNNGNQPFLNYALYYAPGWFDVVPTTNKRACFVCKYSMSRF